MSNDQQQKRQQLLACLHGNIDGNKAGEQNAELLQSLWQFIYVRLAEKRDEIYAEIHDYPLPIPACDQQFNYLLEQRSMIAQELRLVNEILKQFALTGDGLPQIEQFIQFSAFIDSDILRTASS